MGGDYRIYDTGELSYEEEVKKHRESYLKRWEIFRDSLSKEQQEEFDFIRYYSPYETY